MKTKSILKNNKGASLILVIVAMMFVGILATIILTVTVGNNNNVRSAEFSSSNFYTTETIENDFEMLLQKFANNAAAKAYADVLEKMADENNTSDSIEALYQTQFLFYLNQELNSGATVTLVTPDPSDPTQNYYSVDLNALTDGASSIDATVTFKSIYGGNVVHDTTNKTVTVTPFKLGDVVIRYKDENGYESFITTDIEFNANMPSVKQIGEAKTFPYPISKYLVIANGNTNISNGGEAASSKSKFVGNIYSRGNMNVITSNKYLQLRINNLITGGSVNLKDSYVDLGIIGADFKFQDWNGDSSVTSFPKDLYATDLNVTDGEVESNVNLFLADDLVLYGNSPLFKATGGIYAYGNVTDTVIALKSNLSVDTTNKYHDKSSSILVNALSGRLDLSGLSELYIAGTAYTQLPSVAGVYNDVKTESEANDLAFFTQGESLTYRPLQAAYLVPGEYLTSGHNPVKSPEASTVGILDSINTAISNFTSTYLDTDLPLIGVPVKYVNETGVDTYYYFFWNFASKEKALNYFTQLRTNSVLGRSDLIQKSIGMLNWNSSGGYIKLPAAGNIYAKGDLIKCESGNASDFEPVTGTNTSTEIRKGSVEDYNKLIKSLKTDSTDASNDLFDNLFGSSTSDTGAIIHYTRLKAATPGPYDLVGPFQPIDADGKALTKSDETNATKQATIATKYGDVSTETEGEGGGSANNHKSGIVKSDGTLETYTNSKARKYKLIVGDGSELVISSFDSNTSYIIVNDGDITVSAANGGTLGDVRAMFIASGDVTFSNTLNISCLGNVVRVPMTKNESGTFEDGEAEYWSEFEALLNVDVEDTTATKGNIVLRELFGVSGGSLTAGGKKKSNNLVDVNKKNWKKN